jgi:hypothetical protein
VTKEVNHMSVDVIMGEPEETEEVQATEIPVDPDEFFAKNRSGSSTRRTTSSSRNCGISSTRAKSSTSDQNIRGVFAGAGHKNQNSSNRCFSTFPFRRSFCTRATRRGMRSWTDNSVSMQSASSLLAISS